MFVCRFLCEPVTSQQGTDHHDLHPAVSEGAGVGCQPACQVSTSLCHHGIVTNPWQGKVRPNATYDLKPLSVVVFV